MKNKTYLMLGGTFLPAFIGIGIKLAINGEPKLTAKDILIFAALSAVGGYITSQMLKD
jgi:hypothetical protein